MLLFPASRSNFAGIFHIFFNLKLEFKMRRYGHAGKETHRIAEPANPHRDSKPFMVNNLFL